MIPLQEKLEEWQVMLLSKFLVCELFEKQRK
jgi:hypothetical protein